MSSRAGRSNSGCVSSYCVLALPRLVPLLQQLQQLRRHAPAVQVPEAQLQHVLLPQRARGADGLPPQRAVQDDLRARLVPGLVRGLQVEAEVGQGVDAVGVHGPPDVRLPEVGQHHLVQVPKDVLHHHAAGAPHVGAGVQRGQPQVLPHGGRDEVHLVLVRPPRADRAVLAQLAKVGVAGDALHPLEDGGVRDLDLVAPGAHAAVHPLVAPHGELDVPLVVVPVAQVAGRRVLPRARRRVVALQEAPVQPAVAAELGDVAAAGDL